MNKIYLTLLLLACAAGVFPQNNLPMRHYEDEWIKVVEFEKNRYPDRLRKL